MPPKKVVNKPTLEEAIDKANEELNPVTNLLEKFAHKPAPKPRSLVPPKKKVLAPPKIEVSETPMGVPKKIPKVRKLTPAQARKRKAEIEAELAEHTGSVQVSKTHGDYVVVV